MRSKKKTNPKLLLAMYLSTTCIWIGAHAVYVRHPQIAFVSNLQLVTIGLFLIASLFQTVAIVRQQNNRTEDY